MFMLGFILSRMLNPLSYTIFTLFFLLVSISTGAVIPKESLQWFAELISPLYLTLQLVSVLAHFLVVWLAVNFFYQVIIEGKYIAKLSTFGFLIAISIVQVFTYFCMNALPLTGTMGEMERQFAVLVRQNVFGYFELLSLLCMGLLLALYTGILSRTKFKKNIGFIDDTL